MIEIGDNVAFLIFMILIFGGGTFAGIRRFIETRRSDRIEAQQASQQLALDAAAQQADITRTEARHAELTAQLHEAYRFTLEGTPAHQRLGEAFITLNAARDLLDDENLKQAKQQLREAETTLLQIKIGLDRPPQSLPSATDSSSSTPTE